MNDDRIVARNLISYGNATMNLTAQTGGKIIYRLLAERDALQAKLTALEGKRLVPVEPTQEMVDAWVTASGSHKDGRPVWKLSIDRQAYYTLKAALAAAPRSAS